MLLLISTILFAMHQHSYVTQYTAKYLQHLNVLTSSRASPLTSVLFGCVGLYMLYGNHGKEVYMTNTLPETNVTRSLQ